MYNSVCNTCHKEYYGRGQLFCSNHCRVVWTNTYNNVAKRPDVKEKIRKARIGKATILGDKHWNWKGKKIQHIFCMDCNIMLKTIPYGKRMPRYCRKCVHNHHVPLSNASREKIRIAQRGRKLPHTEEWNHKISLAHKKIQHPWLFGAKKSSQTIEKLKQSQKKWWANADNAQKRFMEMKRKPTKPEKFLLEFLEQEFPNEWQYVGDGKVWIEGKNPDFINCNGRKLIIEFDGMYWHRNRVELDKIRNSIYAKYGYSILSINEEDIKYGYEHLKKKIGELYDSS